MQPLAIAIATAASAVLIYTGIIALIFRLTGFAVDLNIIDLHVLVTVIIIVKLYGNFTAGVGTVAIVLHAGGQDPVRDDSAVDKQINMFVTHCSPRANNDGVASTTARA